MRRRVSIRHAASVRGRSQRNAAHLCPAVYESGFCCHSLSTSGVTAHYCKNWRHRTVPDDQGQFYLAANMEVVGARCSVSASDKSTVHPPTAAKRGAAHPGHRGGPGFLSRVQGALPGGRTLTAAEGFTSLVRLRAAGAGNGRGCNRCAAGALICSTSFLFRNVCQNPESLLRGAEGVAASPPKVVCDPVRPGRVEDDLKGRRDATIKERGEEAEPTESVADHALRRNN